MFTPVIRKYQIISRCMCLRSLCLSTNRLCYRSNFSTLIETLGGRNSHCMDYHLREKIHSNVIPAQFLGSLTLKRSFSLKSVSEWYQNIHATISGSTPVAICQDAMLNLHSITGLPWWATIVISTVVARTTFTFPLAVYQNYILAKVENLTLEFKEIIKELNRETAIAKKQFNLSDEKLYPIYRKSMRKQWDMLIVRDNCHPLKATILIWFQVPLWVCMSFALRNLLSMQPISDALALITFTELTVGGFGWIPNLTDIDHSLIFPVILGITNLTIIELQSMSKSQTPSKLSKRFAHVFRGLTVLLAVISAYVPSALTIYWTTSSACALAQNMILLSPKVRRKCGIPITPNELTHPYIHLKERIGERIEGVKSAIKWTTK